jgi:hypothetical protein
LQELRRKVHRGWRVHQEERAEVAVQKLYRVRAGQQEGTGDLGEVVDQLGHGRLDLVGQDLMAHLKI